MHMCFECYYSPHLARKNISFIYYAYSFNFSEVLNAYHSDQYASDKTRPFNCREIYVCGNRLRESNELRENMENIIEAHGIT